MREIAAEYVKNKKNGVWLNCLKYYENKSSIKMKSLTFELPCVKSIHFFCKSITRV